MRLQQVRLISEYSVEKTEEMLKNITTDLIFQTVHIFNVINCNIARFFTFLEFEIQFSNNFDILSHLKVEFCEKKK